jgi:DNA mismatch repair protein MutS2
MTISPKTLSDLEWSKIQAALSARCQTALGAERARQLLPDLPREAAEEELAVADELRALSDAAEPPPFGGLRDLREKLTLAEKGGILEGSDLLEVAGHLYGLDALRRHLTSREDKARLASQIAQEIPPLVPLADAISRAFDEGGRLKDTASPDLGHLRAAAARLAEQLKKTVTKLLGDTRVASFLQDNYYTVRDDRYVLPVRSEHRGEVKGIVHGTSGSGATLFIEPEEVVDFGNRYKIALAAVEREERRILAELTGAVMQRSAALRQGSELAARLDLANAKARLSRELELTNPEIGLDRAPLRLKRARHPHLLLQKVDVVANDIALAGGARVLVISGPNTGGKTVSLKTAGLAALMLRAGVPVPADPGSAMPYYKRVFSDIGDEQSLEQALSTFSGRIVNTLAILKEAGPGDLVLLDEVASGTEPAQGAALACAILEAFAQSGAHVLTTTHYELPKTLALKDPAFHNASVGFDAAKLAPTYRLLLGVPGRSSALEIATRLGAPVELVERARSFISEGGRAFEETLAALDAERVALEDERRLMERARKAAEDEARRAKERSEALKAREQKLVGGAYDGLLRALSEARAQVERADKRLRERQSHLKDIAGNEAAVKKAREAVAQAETAERRAAESLEEQRRKERAARAAPPSELTPGRAVYVASLDAEGVVEEAPDEKGRVRVRVGLLKTQVPVEELSLASAPRREAGRRRAPREAGPPGAPAAARPLTDEPPPMTSDITLDLRGMRVDDALTEADAFLDQMLQRDRTHCYFIHGHGTGALKQALREFLRGSPLVAEVNAGDLNRGGDGITIARMA